MRISDWSSDVCSSDLVPEEIAEQSQAHDTDEAAPKPKRAPRARRAPKSEAVADESHTMDAAILPPSISRRSEEHTSELQSLMRISYAVFCLKKKTNTILHTYTSRIVRHPKITSPY